MNRSYLFILAAAVWAPHPLMSQASGDFTTRVRDHSYPLVVEGGLFAGEGADILLSEARQSQFVMVGEEHGNVETPYFVEVLLRSLRSHGYDRLALEVSPSAADVLQDLATSGDPAESIVQFGHEHRVWFPNFSQYDADARLLTAVEDGSVELWGLDQEFYFTTPYLLHRMVSLAPSAEARGAAERFYSTDLRVADADSTRRNPVGRFFQVVTAEDFELLRRLYGEQPEARVILDELEVSWSIYAARDNVARSRLMDRHLRQYLEAAAEDGDAVPRVVFKLGGVHAGRGLNVFDIPDVGNAASELAQANGSKSLHLIVLARGDLLETEAQTRTSDDMDSVWTLVDLRALRGLPKVVGGLDNVELGDLSLRYDFAVLAPELTPSARLPW